MRSRVMKLIIFIIAILVASYLYSEISFQDARATDFFYFIYGLDKNVDIMVLVRWYFGICLLFAFLFHYYKNAVANNKANRIVRYGNKRKYNLIILIKGVLTAILCWLSIVIVMGLFKFSTVEYFIVKGNLLKLSMSFLVIMTLSTLLILLDSIIESVYAFMFVNIFAILSITIGSFAESPLFKILLFPNFLMGMRHSNNMILTGMAGVFLLEIIIVITYIKITDMKDIMR